MKNFRKSICLILTLISSVMFGLFAFTACGDENDEPTYELPKNCDAVFEIEGEWDDTYRSFIAICDSYEAIQEELRNHGVEAWENNKVREYAEEHIEDKSFVVSLLITTSSREKYFIKEFDIYGEKLTMYIKESNSDGDIVGATVMGSYVLIAGVEKSFVEGVTELQRIFIW